MIGGDNMTAASLLDRDQIVFPKLGLEFRINDTAFTIFGFEIKWYSIFIILGIIIAIIYGLTRMRKYGLDPNRAIDAVIGGILGGLIGARIYYVVLAWDTYDGDWRAILNTRNGGLAIYGGIIGAILVGGIVAKIRKVRLLPLLDIAGVGFLIGQGVGRWGNFINQEAFGCNTDSIFGMNGGKIQRFIINNYDNLTTGSDTVVDPAKPVHPCFLYESFWCILGFVILAIFAAKFRKYDGQIFLMYIGWYGLGRFFIEGLRTDSLMLGNLRISQILSALCVVASVILLIVFGSKVKRMGDDYQLYYKTEESRSILRQKSGIYLDSTSKPKNKKSCINKSDIIENPNDLNIEQNTESNEVKEKKVESEED